MLLSECYLLLIHKSNFAPFLNHSFQKEITANLLIATSQKKSHETPQPKSVKNNTNAWNLHKPDTHLINFIVLQNCLLMSMASPHTDTHEQNSKEDVADIRENVIEVAQWSKGMRTPEVVITQVLVSRYI